MNPSSLNPDLHRKISMVLGRDVPLSEEGSNRSFDEFTEKDLDDFRLLERNSGILAVSYIKYRLKGSVDLNELVAFYATVIQRGVPLED